MTGKGLKVHGRFVGLNFCEEHALVDLIPYFGMPFCNDSFVHCIAQSRHRNNYGHGLFRNKWVITFYIHVLPKFFG